MKTVNTWFVPNTLKILDSYAIKKLLTFSYIYNEVYLTYYKSDICN